MPDVEESLKKLFEMERLEGVECDNCNARTDTLKGIRL
jgi:hypothetical protein